MPPARRCNCSNSTPSLSTPSSVSRQGTSSGHRYNTRLSTRLSDDESESLHSLIEETCLRKKLSDLAKELKDFTTKKQFLAVIIVFIGISIYSCKQSTSVEKIDDIQTQLKVIKEQEKQIIDLREEIGSMKRALAVRVNETKPEKLEQDDQNNQNHHAAIRQMVRDEILLYAADKTGMADFALQSSGGRIYSTRDTETYKGGNMVVAFLGRPICKFQYGPDVIIQPNIVPGECWAFKGQNGSVVIELLGPVYVSAITLEHIPSSISPSGLTSSAPKEFTVSGLEDPDNPESAYLFGVYQYFINGPTLQTFEVAIKTASAYRFVEFKVWSNHGHPNYTCIYRIRVHGTLAGDAYN